MTPEPNRPDEREAAAGLRPSTRPDMIHAGILASLRGDCNPNGDDYDRRICAALDRAIDLLQAPKASNPWQEAILDALAVSCMDAPASESPRDILRRIISFHEETALDPAVSERAAALLRRDAPREGASVDENDIAAAILATEDGDVSTLDDWLRDCSFDIGDRLNFGLRAARRVLALLPACEERRLTKPATVGNTTFGTGVKESLVIDRAQREHDYRRERQAAALADRAPREGGEADNDALWRSDEAVQVLLDIGWRWNAQVRRWLQPEHRPQPAGDPLVAEAGRRYAALGSRPVVDEAMVGRALMAPYRDGNVSDMLRGGGDEEAPIMRAALTAALRAPEQPT